ncbi:MAG: thrombospondin type 3 repeat-containing protein [Myxococcales bacterium]|nr:thrombospondin type 3 repeat-containing protein [Myxococcales bacterium]
MMGVLSKAVAILILFAGCNFVYGLEPTGAAPDGDGDGVSDVEDNCTGITNSDQVDADADGLGDLCDLCPLVFDDRNHDEDLDGVGDRCDACPGFAEFQRDGDGDGIGDLCDDVPSADTQRSVFDPFLELDPGRWQTGPTSWRVDNEAVVPVAELGPGEGLRPIVALSNRPWAIHVGVRSRRVWTGTDTFGIRIVDADGTKGQLRHDLRAERVCSEPPGKVDGEHGLDPGVLRRPAANHPLVHRRADGWQYRLRLHLARSLGRQRHGVSQRQPGDDRADRPPEPRAHLLRTSQLRRVEAWLGSPEAATIL